MLFASDAGLYGMLIVAGIALFCAMIKGVLTDGDGGSSTAETFARGARRKSSKAWKWWTEE